MIKKGFTILLCIYILTFAGTVCAYSTEMYSIDIPSTYTETKKDNFYNEKGESIIITFGENPFAEDENAYSKKNLSLITETILDESMNKEMLYNKMKEAYGEYFEDEYLWTIADKFKFDGLLIKETTYFTKNNYKCFHFLTKYKFEDASFYTDQYMVFSGNYAFSVTVGSWTKEHFESQEVNDILNSFTILNFVNMAVEEEPEEIDASAENETYSAADIIKKNLIILAIIAVAVFIIAFIIASCIGSSVLHYNSKSGTYTEEKIPENKKAAAIIMLLLIYFPLFGEYLLELSPYYSGLNEFEEAFTYSLINFVICTFIMMIFPGIMRFLNVTRFEYKQGRKICLLNSLVLVAVSLALNILYGFGFVGGIGAIFYYFINMCLFTKSGKTQKEETAVRPDSFSINDEFPKE